MDRDAAIARFTKLADDLPGLPFVTDPEILQIYGEEVASALAELQRTGREAQACRQCDSNCCREHGCEFYAPQFTQCPIHELRPAICRFHFCQKFQDAGGSAIKELSEIFLYSLSAAAANGASCVKYFNPPPFADMIPGLIEIVRPLIEGARSGELKTGFCRRRIRDEVLQYTQRKRNMNKDVNNATR